ncbi:MAG: hypothetical protein ACR2F2_12815, partial [Pyrinomonadaceae bacterium]
MFLDFTFRLIEFFFVTALRKSSVLFIFFFLGSVLPVFSQTADDEIRVETELVTIEVSVTDKSGTPVKNLQPEDFKIFEDGIERKIEFFEPIRKQNENRPLSLVFALDTS